MAVKTKTEAPKSTEPKKIEEKDLNTLKQLQADTDKLVYNLGQLYVQKEKLNETENELKKSIKAIEQREEALGKELSSKYGIGTVNIEAGTFTPQAT
jgi:prefoldin subunit 5